MNFTQQRCLISVRHFNVDLSFTHRRLPLACFCLCCPCQQTECKICLHTSFLTQETLLMCSFLPLLIYYYTGILTVVLLDVFYITICAYPCLFCRYFQFLPKRIVRVMASAGHARRPTSGAAWRERRSRLLNASWRSIMTSSSLTTDIPDTLTLKHYAGKQALPSSVSLSDAVQ